MKSIGLLLANCIVLSGMLMVHNKEDSRATPVFVRRRSFQDIYTRLLNQQNITEDAVCNVDNGTYLVTENQCISNHYLFKGNIKQIYVPILLIYCVVPIYRVFIRNNSSWRSPYATTDSEYQNGRHFNNLTNYKHR